MINMGPRPMPTYADHRKENALFLSTPFHPSFKAGQFNSAQKMQFGAAAAAELTINVWQQNYIFCKWWFNQIRAAYLQLSYILLGCGASHKCMSSACLLLFSHTLKFSSWGHIVFLRLTSTDRLQNISKNQFWNLSVLHRGVDSGLALSFSFRLR